MFTRKCDEPLQHGPEHVQRWIVERSYVRQRVVNAAIQMFRRINKEMVKAYMELETNLQVILRDVKLSPPLRKYDDITGIDNGIDEKQSQTISKIVTEITQPSRERSLDHLRHEYFPVLDKLKAAIDRL